LRCSSLTDVRSGGIDTPGKIIGATLDRPVKEAHLFGARWHKTQTPATLERLYDSEDYTFLRGLQLTPGHSDFDDKPIYKDIRVCLLVDGVVTAYEGDPGFSRTPATGDVMVEIPLYYYQIVDTADYRDYLISDTQRDGFAPSPRHVINGRVVSKIYASAYTLNSDYRSISGNLSITSISRATARAGCMSRGTGYSQQDYAEFWTVAMLYLVETAELNAQYEIGAGFTHANNTGQVVTGKTDIIPYHSGRTQGGLNAAQNPAKYRGMENLWGNIWTWCDGIDLDHTSVYINTNPATYANGADANYTLLSYTVAPTAGFQKALGYDPSVPWAQMCTDATGSATTYVSDTYNAPTGSRVICLGGAFSNGSDAGFFACNANNAIPFVHAYIGARLLYIPQN
jgi:hypothetical protein